MITLKKYASIAAIPSLAIALFGAMPSAEAAKDVFQRTKPHVNVGRVGHVGQVRAKSTRQLGARSAKSFRRAVKAPRNRLKTVRPLARGKAKIRSTPPIIILRDNAAKVRTIPRRTAPVATFKKRLVIPPPTPSPPPGPKLTSSGPGPGVVADLYCKDGSPNHVPCDSIFWAYCALIGGTPFKSQPWGGKTCFHPTEW